MGYYSDVTIVLENEDFDKLLEKAKEECIDAYKLIINVGGNGIHDGRNEIYRSEYFTTICMPHLKWYNCLEVKYIEDSIDKFPHIFYRIGEGIDDVEIREKECDEMLFCVSVRTIFDFENAGTRAKFNENGQLVDY